MPHHSYQLAIALSNATRKFKEADTHMTDGWANSNRMRNLAQGEMEEGMAFLNEAMIHATEGIKLADKSLVQFDAYWREVQSMLDCTVNKDDVLFYNDEVREVWKEQVANQWLGKFLALWS